MKPPSMGCRVSIWARFRPPPPISRQAWVFGQSGDENGNATVHSRVRWRTSTVRVADQMYVETREAGTRKQKRSVTYLDPSTRQAMVVVSGSLSKGDLSAQICASTEEQFEFSRSGRWSNAIVRGKTRSGEPVFCLRFLGHPYFGPHDIQVLLSRAAQCRAPPHRVFGCAALAPKPLSGRRGLSVRGSCCSKCHRRVRRFDSGGRDDGRCCGGDRG